MIVPETVTSNEIKDETIQLDDLSLELRVLLGLGHCPNTSSLGFVYQGQVTIVADPSNFLGGGINVGEMIKGVYCYAPNTPDTFGSESVGFYSLEFYSISIGNDDFVCSDGMVLDFSNVWKNFGLPIRNLNKVPQLLYCLICG